MAHTTRGWLQYASNEFGTNFEIKADNVTAANNGQTLTIGPTFLNFWPFHHSDLRHVIGTDALGKKDSCVATSTGSPIYALGATFQDMLGNTYTVTSLVPEKFSLKHAK